MPKITGYKASKFVKRSYGEDNFVAVYGVYPTFEAAEKELVKSGKLELSPWEEYLPGAWRMYVEDKWTEALFIDKVEVDDIWQRSWAKMGYDV
jgi:hypothetical protein